MKSSILSNLPPQRQFQLPFPLLFYVEYFFAFFVKTLK